MHHEIPGSGFIGLRFEGGSNLVLTGLLVASVRFLEELSVAKISHDSKFQAQSSTTRIGAV